MNATRCQLNVMKDTHVEFIYFLSLLWNLLLFQTSFRLFNPVEFWSVEKWFWIFQLEFFTKPRIKLAVNLSILCSFWFVILISKTNMFAAWKHGQHRINRNTTIAAPNNLPIKLCIFMIISIVRYLIKNSKCR